MNNPHFSILQETDPGFELNITPPTGGNEEDRDHEQDPEGEEDLEEEGDEDSDDEDAARQAYFKRTQPEVHAAVKALIDSLEVLNEENVSSFNEK